MPPEDASPTRVPVASRRKQSGGEAAGITQQPAAGCRAALTSHAGMTMVVKATIVNMTVQILTDGGAAAPTEFRLSREQVASRPSMMTVSAVSPVPAKCVSRSR